MHADLNMEDEEEFLASLGMMSKNAHFYSLAATPQMRARISRHQSAYELAVAPTKHADLRFIDECRPWIRFPLLYRLLLLSIERPDCSLATRTLDTLFLFSSFLRPPPVDVV